MLCSETGGNRSTPKTHHIAAISQPDRCPLSIGYRCIVGRCGPAIRNHGRSCDIARPSAIEVMVDRAEAIPCTVHRDGLSVFRECPRSSAINPDTKVVPVPEEVVHVYRDPQIVSAAHSCAAHAFEAHTPAGRRR